MRFIIPSLLALSLTACNTTQQTSSDPKIDAVHYLTVLHTNDHHGRFWHNEDGEYGMAARKTLIDQLRAQAKAQGHSLVLLSGGDINTGVPESDLQHAEPDFKGMSLLGYDAMAIGNHEFDNPLDVLDKQIAWSNFPFLSANILHKHNGEHAYQPYTIIEKQGLKIAIIGLTTIDTVKIANPEFVGGLDFVEPAPITAQLSQRIRQQYKPDVTIAVTHMGHYHDAAYGINAPGDVTLARNLPAGTLDMIIGGHSQEPICIDENGEEDANFAPGKACKPDQQNGIWIMQAHEWGKYVGKAVFRISESEKTLESYELIPVNLKNEEGQWAHDYIEHDSELKAFLAPYQKAGESKIAGAVGEVDAFLDGRRNTVRFRQSPLGDLIIKAQMAAVGADFGLISGGGIRASIKAGEVSYKDILTVHPFRNRITYIDWSGQELIDYMSIVSAFPPDSGAYLQYHGIEFDIQGGKLTNVKIQGKPVDPTKTYRMSINSYNAAGGDGYPVLTDFPGYTATDSTDAQVLRDFIERHSPIKRSTLSN
ncbi:bifunctional UDP-sugar hydrolase/5'-nucleotidase UshA [Pseudoalteromonas rubra]|uniref:Bifunctional UDP-sugar hydrolase/5'-nucleotidase n=1 Tax=Pseudoalteromonas rubra TaxID=43658 RepID=A0A5S3X5B2_9GAMM|nr:bifunctional UDP-sugar hydrolase/5'-nucleotidase UshA [Pseudoalteromonas rubra]TMP39479.1 bifunctional UDP-sugar hydrolase/5'-nucleotidase [Pseudoalteromonas rubra]